MWNIYIWKYINPGHLVPCSLSECQHQLKAPLTCGSLCCPHQCGGAPSLGPLTKEPRGRVETLEHILGKAKRKELSSRGRNLVYRLMAMSQNSGYGYHSKTVAICPQRHSESIKCMPAKHVDQSSILRTAKRPGASS